MIANIFWILIALLGFGLLIIAHEFGHCIAAKRGGVQVDEFWIGMGPKLFQKKVGETTYCLCLLPVGGACVMAGEDQESENPRAFGNAKWLTRFVILVAGVVMNFLLGFVILLCISSGVKQEALPVIESFSPDFAAEGEQGLMVGDRIVKIDGYRIFTGADVSEGLRRGAADGKFDFVVRREGQTVQIPGLTLRNDLDLGLGNGQKGYGLRFAVADLNVLGHLRYAVVLAVNDARMVWHTLGDLLSGAVGFDQLSGPVGVVAVTAQTAQAGAIPFWALLAFISINLGVMNLLPIPGLDGGRLLFLIVEGIRRRPLDKKLEGYVNLAGLCALFALILYVTGQDIMRLL